MAILVDSQPIFQRAMRVISTITQANPAVITTTTDHQYITGMIVRLNIPLGFGMQQVNQQYGEIIVTGDTTFSIDIDTREMDPFLSLISLGNTDGSGAIAGTISTNLVPFSVGQAFFIGDEYYLIINPTGAMYCQGDGAGTFDISTGVYSITGAPVSTAAYFTSTVYPLNLQYPQVTPIGVESSNLSAATQNVLGTNFYS
jgi:hypothetical protein